MNFVLGNRSLISKNVRICYIMYTFLALPIIYTLYHLRLSIFPIDQHLLNLPLDIIDRVYHRDGIAYDYYSTNDLNQSKTGYQWKMWSLPNEIDSSENNQTSPFVISKLPFIDAIYITTDPRLNDRHQNLKKAFHHQGISIESIKWKMKWNHETCNSKSSHSYVYQRLNLKDQPLDREQQRRCALTMKHVDVWYEMAEQKIPLGLILEDDAIFVPFFKEKLTRMISTAIRSGALRLNGACVQSNGARISEDEWIDQNPMFVIGTCLNLHSQFFKKDFSNAPPVLSTHKSDPSRCAHAYLLTSCSAQALVDQIHAQENDLLPPDLLQNYLFRLSSTLQSFWMDPPLAYQGNQVIDLDNVPSFKTRTYK